MRSRSVCSSAAGPPPCCRTAEKSDRHCLAQRHVLDHYIGDLEDAVARAHPPVDMDRLAAWRPFDLAEDGNLRVGIRERPGYAQPFAGVFAEALDVAVNDQVLEQPAVLALLLRIELRPVATEYPTGNRVRREILVEHATEALRPTARGALRSSSNRTPSPAKDSTSAWAPAVIGSAAREGDRQSAVNSAANPNKTSIRSRYVVHRWLSISRSFYSRGIAGKSSRLGPCAPGGGCPWWISAVRN